MRGMKDGQSGRRWWILVGFAAIILLAALFGRVVVSRAWSNAGALAYSRALAVAGDGATAPDALAKAEPLLETALRLDGRNAAAHRLLGFVLWEQGRRDEAAAHWREAGIPLADLTRAANQARHADKLEKALDWYHRAIAVAPARSDAYASAGTTLIAIGDGEQALAYLDKAIALGDFISKSRETSAHFNRGDLLRAMERDSEARAEYEWVLEQEPDSYWAYLQLGRIEWEVDGDAARAEALYLRGLEIAPDLKWAYNRLGELYRETGRSAEALQMYRKALAIDPEDETAQKQVRRLESGGGQ
jgi:tetratricopeptide (TPR) repeat protein